MNSKSGFLRRVVILIAFGWFYAQIVLNTDALVANPEHRSLLRVLLFVAIGYGIVHMLAVRLGDRGG